MEYRKIAGGKVLGVNPDQLKLPMYADNPKARLGSPATLFGNVGLFAQLSECSILEYKSPSPTMVKVVFREIEKERYLALACANAPGPDVYELKFESTTKAPTIRGLKPLFDSVKITLHTDLWYEDETEILQDETLGHIVAINWTRISTRPRREGESEVAATQQTDGE